MISLRNKSIITKPNSYIQYLLESNFVTINENTRIILYLLSTENFDKLYEKLMFRSEVNNSLNENIALMIYEIEILSLSKNLV